MKKYWIYLLLLFPVFAISQEFGNAYQVKYVESANGEESKNSFSIYYQDGIVYLSSAESKIQHYSDLIEEQNISTIQIDGKTYKNLQPFDQLPESRFDTNKLEVLGFQCQYATYSYFSNKIEVWYTENAAVKGSPYSRFLPTARSLALQIRVNGNNTITADTIIKLTDYTPLNNFKEGAIEVNDAEFEELKINARFTKLSVFKDEQINFNPKIKVAKEEDLERDSTYHFASGAVVMKKILLTDELRKSDYVFARLTCKSNGDAYDRTGSVFMVPAKNVEQLTVLDAYQKGLDLLPVYTDNRGQNYQGIMQEGNYTPPVELMRFFTSFGANHFNELRAINNYPWADNVVYEQEVTSLIPNDEEEIWIGIFIGNYDGGGHIVSLELDFHPPFTGEEEEQMKYIDPLFSTVNTMEMQGQNYGKLFNNDTLRMEFEIPEQVEDINLLFTSTGHGGWGGGDEFNPKLNQILIDGVEVFSIVPWRSDCATYRMSNPASGNFENGLSSSDLSRSNWCPATLTPPYLIPLKNIKAGRHQIEVIIDQGEDEGNSSSSWAVSGVICGKVTE